MKVCLNCLVKSSMMGLIQMLERSKLCPEEYHIHLHFDSDEEALDFAKDLEDSKRADPEFLRYRAGGIASGRGYFATASVYAAGDKFTAEIEIAGHGLTDTRSTASASNEADVPGAFDRIVRTLGKLLPESALQQAVSAALANLEKDTPKPPGNKAAPTHN